MEPINLEPYQSPRFELVLHVRDHEGKPTGKIKNFTTDNHEELDNWYQRNTGTKKNKKRENKPKEENK